MNARRFSSTRQRGSVIVFAALGLSLMVILLSVSDIGFLYFYKREYQKAADLSAMAGAKSLIGSTGTRSCVGNATPAAQANAAQNLGGKNYNLVVSCGKWNPSATTDAARFDTSVASNAQDAVKSVVSGVPPRFLPFIGSQTLTATAIAAADQPVAVLSIRSTLASIDTQQSALLNAVIGGMLGGSINLPVASWNGLLNTDINLLNYLDALAIHMGVNAGNYDQVLATPISVGNLLDVAADVLPNGAGPDVSTGLNSLVLLGLGLPQITLGQLLGVQSNLPTSALDVGLNLLQLVQGGVQLAGKNNVATVSLPVVGVPGLATTSVKVKAIEPAQMSAIGNPALAVIDPYGANAIAVRTAQVRTLVTVNLSGVTSLINNLTSALTPLLNPIVNFLNSAGFNGLNLLGAVGNLLQDVFELLLTVCNNNCSARNSVYAEALSQPLQISLDAATATARVTNYSCGASRSLTAAANTSVAYLRVGTMNETNLFSAATPTVSPLGLVEIGYRKVRPRQCFLILGIGSCSDEQWEQPNGSWLTNGKSTAKRYVISGLGLKVDGPIGGSSTTSLVYTPPGLPEVGQAPAYKDAPSSAVLGGVGGTLSSGLLPYSSASSGVLGALLGGTLSLLSGVVSAVTNLVDDVVIGVLDPIVNTLLTQLGINLADTDVGANLSCEGGGATLVN